MLALEPELGSESSLGVGYVANPSLKLTMRQAQNYPDRLTGIPADPTFSSFFLNTPLGSSSYHSLQVTLKKRFSRGLTFEANFTQASNISLSDASVTGQSSVRDSNNLTADRGPTPFQIHNNFNGSFIVQVSGEQARPGNLRRNALYGNIMWKLDASPRKSFAITLKAEFMNAFNHTNLGGLVSNVANGSFGQLTSASA